MQHLVVTRLLVGVARPTAFMLNARVMLETTFRSMAAQTSDNFTWVITTDSMIDPGSEALVRAALAPHPNFHLEKLDPFETEGQPIGIAGLCEKYLGTTRDVITTRLDDDDGIRRDYIERAQAAIAKTGAPLVSYSHSLGLSVVSQVKRHARVKSRGSSAGMTMLSPDVNAIHVHSFPHLTVHSRVREQGGVAIRVKGKTPYFLSALHMSSDSREGKDSAAVMAEIERTYRQSKRRSRAYRALLDSFGLPADYHDRIRAIRRNFIDVKPSLFPITNGSEKPLSRLAMKGQYRKLAEEARRAMTSGNERQQAKMALRYALLRQAFYLL